jgi:hypothetical protein
MRDVVRKTYDCPNYGQVVTVLVERLLCTGKNCPVPPPHVLINHFKDCSDIVNCEVGNIEIDGTLNVANIRLCPAYLILDVNGKEIGD